MGDGMLRAISSASIVSLKIRKFPIENTKKKALKGSKTYFIFKVFSPILIQQIIEPLKIPVWSRLCVY
jgi:hypothetical protein